MKKSMIFVGLLAVGFANAQTAEELKGRVGINTQTPKASLDITRHTGIPTQNPQGLILPHLSTEQRDEFTRSKLTNGLMIFNTTKNCIDWWNGTKWQCADGTQADTPLPQTTPIQLPEIEIGNSMHFFSSIYDDDYLSDATGTPTIATPTAAASLATQSADGVASGGTHEPILNVQGKIPTKANALKVAIPIRSEKDVTLPAFTTYLKIPAQYTKKHQEAIVTLSWEDITLIKEKYFIIAKLYAEGEEIELKQLDLVAGLGNDHKGIFMGSFKYPRTKTESEGPKAGWTGHYDLRLVSGIPDKSFNKLTNIGSDGTKYRHRFIYAPVYIPIDLDDGQIYLNNNLGANYANIYHSQFNSGQQAKNYTDHHAYGSIGRWFREFDGHELITWVDGTSSSPINKPTYADVPGYGWSSTRNTNQFVENCPLGWHTPTAVEFSRIRSIGGRPIMPATVNNMGRYMEIEGLRLINLHKRSQWNGSALNAVMGYNSWGSMMISVFTPGSGRQEIFRLIIEDSVERGTIRTMDIHTADHVMAFPVRCIKD